MQARVDGGPQATVDARAAAKEAARQANIDLSKTARADLKRLRLEGDVAALKAAEEAEIAEGAATKGAEAAAARRFSGGVTDVDYDEDAVWEATRQRVQNRLARSTPAWAEGDAQRGGRRGADGAHRGGASAGVLPQPAGPPARRRDPRPTSSTRRGSGTSPATCAPTSCKYMDEEAATPAAAGAQRFTVQQPGRRRGRTWARG